MRQLIAITSIIVGSWGGHVVAQAGSSGSGFDPWGSLASIGIGGLISVPLIVILRILLKRLEKLEKLLEERDDEKVKLLQQQLEREREVANTVVPLLERVGALLHDTPGVIDKAFASAQGQAQRADQDVRMRQMELVVDGILKRITDHAPDTGT